MEELTLCQVDRIKGLAITRLDRIKTGLPLLKMAKISANGLTEINAVKEIESQIDHEVDDLADIIARCNNAVQLFKQKISMT